MKYYNTSDYVYIDINDTTKNELISYGDYVTINNRNSNSVNMTVSGSHISLVSTQNTLSSALILENVFDSFIDLSLRDYNDNIYLNNVSDTTILTGNASDWLYSNDDSCINKNCFIASSSNGTFRTQSSLRLYNSTINCRSFCMFYSKLGSDNIYSIVGGTLNACDLSERNDTFYLDNCCITKNLNFGVSPVVICDSLWTTLAKVTDRLYFDMSGSAYVSINNNDYRIGISQPKGGNCTIDCNTSLFVSGVPDEALIISRGGDVTIENAEQCDLHLVKTGVNCTSTYVARAYYTFDYSDNSLVRVNDARTSSLSPDRFTQSLNDISFSYDNTFYSNNISTILPNNSTITISGSNNTLNASDVINTLLYFDNCAVANVIICNENSHFTVSQYDSQHLNVIYPKVYPGVVLSNSSSHVLTSPVDINLKFYG